MHIIVQDYLLPTSAVGPPSGLLIDWPPETVYLLYQVLCWYLSCHPLCFPSLKVQDFLNTKHEEQCIHGSKTLTDQDIPLNHGGNIQTTLGLHSKNCDLRPCKGLIAYQNREGCYTICQVHSNINLEQNCCKDDRCHKGVPWMECNVDWYSW